jgi:hypothetical protein
MAMLLHSCVEMMVTVGIALTVLLATALPAWGQAQTGTELRGHIEEIRDVELVVRGEDGRLYFVDTAGMPSVELSVLNPGDDVAIATKGDGARGPIGRSVRQRQPAGSPGR